MPHYFFDLWDGRELSRDEEGLQLRDMEAAIAEGRRALASIARDAIDQGSTDLIEIRIRDGDEGPVILTVRIDVEQPRPDGADPT
jgi:hypothetical protein